MVVVCGADDGNALETFSKTQNSRCRVPHVLVRIQSGTSVVRRWYHLVMPTSRRQFIGSLSLAMTMPRQIFAAKAPATTPGGKVMTVAGPINAAELGVTLPHEHLLVVSGACHALTSHFGSANFHKCLSLRT